jgi:hypothetical protein
MDEQKEQKGLRRRIEEKIKLSPEKKRICLIAYYGICFLIIGYSMICITAEHPSESTSSPSTSFSTPSSTPSNSYSSTPSYSDTDPNEYAPGVTVIATPAVVGDNLIIRTRVNNRNSYPINKKIRLFAEDVRGVQYIVDVIYADLEPNQVGNSTSSIPLSKVGTPPHKIIVD